MGPEAFVSQVREHYLDQFEAFVEQQRLACAQGAAEVKLALSDGSEVYQRLYCVDFIRYDSDPQVIELQPERTLDFDVIDGSFGGAALVIQHLRWDDVVVHHDAPEPLGGLADWFEKWFDPEDQRHVQGAAVGNVIHTLLAQPSSLSMDLGSAEPDALWEMLDLLEAAGATSLRITESWVKESGT